MTATALAVPVLVTRAGLVWPTPVATDAVNGNTFLNDGDTLILVTNTDTASHTLSVNYAAQLDGSSPAAKTFTIAAGVTKGWADWPTKIYGTKTLINVDSALLHIAVVRLAN